MGSSYDIYQKMILLMMRSKRHLVPACDKREMTPVQGMLLIMLEPGQGKSMNELSCRMGCDASNVTGLIDKLDVLGAIERTADPGDRRVKMIRLTPLGETIRGELLDGLQKAEALDLQKLSDEEQKLLENLIDKLIKKSKC